MRLVELRSEEQQSRAVLFRSRERLVHQRTELVNALRACLYEYGHIVPQGIAQLGRIGEIIDDPNSDLPKLAREECRDMLEQIGEIAIGIIDGRSEEHTSELQSLMRSSYAVFCLKKQTSPIQT